MNWILALCIGLVLGPVVAAFLVFMTFVVLLLLRSRRPRGFEGRAEAG